MSELAQLKARVDQLETENGLLRLQLCRMGHSRSALCRIARVGEMLTQRGPFRKLNATVMAAELGVSTKTIGRDIEFLRSQLGWTVQYNPCTDSYTLENTEQARARLQALLNKAA